MTELRELAGMPSSSVNRSPTWDAVELGAAWAEVESLLPPERGWFELFRQDVSFNRDAGSQYYAEAHVNYRDDPHQWADDRPDLSAWGPTPAWALRALATKLRALA